MKNTCDNPACLDATCPPRGTTVIFILKSIRSGDYITQVTPNYGGGMAPLCHISNRQRNALRFATRNAADLFMRQHMLSNAAFEIVGIR